MTVGVGPGLCAHAALIVAVMGKARDEFSAATKLQIAKRAGWLCSYPICRVPTVGATADGAGEINIGTAAHICAAAPGGPRYDINMSPEERSSASNGIWMCRDHGTAIDFDPQHFTIELLHQWKKEAERDSWYRVLNGSLPLAGTPSSDQLRGRLREAARKDLSVFRNTSRWPRSAVALTLRVDGIEQLATTLALATAARTLENLILIAGPGMGKTTTLLQIAEGALVGDAGIPIFVSLGDWATERRPLVESILMRPAFASISEAELRGLVSGGDVVLLLDGWNEINGDTRDRARVEIERLKAQLPALSVVVSTRQQSLDVPFAGKRVELLALSETQQLEIARTVTGKPGAAMLDRALRTPGVRDLVSVPLYLNALLALPAGDPFPKTREEVLRRFVAAHEAYPGHAAQLRTMTRGFQQEYLDALALSAMQAANTSIPDRDARRAISTTSVALIGAGQMAMQPEPVEVLDVLVDSHVLVRAGDTPGVAFQHQQFQEWFASHDVERRMFAAASDHQIRRQLQVEVLDKLAWEEAILFAVERMSREIKESQVACALAIVAAFDVDPMLAAEMIHRSTDVVWHMIAAQIADRIDRWHTQGKSDRGQRFMMNSGRPEFIDRLWPLIANEDDQVSLTALRNCRRFRPSILGNNPEARICALAPKVREMLLSEMVMHGGIEGIELATAIARADPDPSVQSEVAEALHFRLAYRHLAELLRGAPDAVLDRFVQHEYDLDGHEDDVVDARLGAARSRAASSATAPLDHLRRLALSQPDQDRAGEVTALVAKIEIENGRDVASQPIYRLQELYPAAVAAGVLERVRAGRTLFYGADDMLAASGLALEDDNLLAIALADTDHDQRAEAAASVLGPFAVGRLVDALRKTDAAASDRSRRYDKSTNDRRQVLLSRIDHVPAASLLDAVQARSDAADADAMGLFARLLSCRFDDHGRRARVFSAESLDAIRDLASNWGERMFAMDDVPRHDMATIARLIGRVPNVRLLPTLQRMLDHNLERYAAAHAAAAAANWRPGPDTDQARSPETHQYLHAFLALDAQETRALMRGYLTDPHFGELAVQVIVGQWVAKNEPPPEGRFSGGPDFSHVGARRAAWLTDPAATSEDADEIFRLVEALIANGVAEEQRQLGVRLATVATRLPHGDRTALFAKVLEIAPRRARATLTLNRVLSGEAVPTQVVVDGIRITLEAAQNEPWILMNSDAWELREWLQLLPFTDDPSQIVGIIRSIPPQHRPAARLQGLVSACATSPSPGSNDALFELAALEPELYADYAWRSALLQMEDASTFVRLVALVADSVVGTGGHDDWSWARDLGKGLERFPEVRRDVYARLRDEVEVSGLSLLASAVVKAPDEDGLLLLVELEQRLKRDLVGYHSVELAVTERVPLDGTWGAHEIIPVAARSLRKRLLAMTRDGGPDDRAARALTLIDGIRGEHGPAHLEPRHPDLASGKPWPILTAHPEA